MHVPTFSLIPTPPHTINPTPPHTINPHPIPSHQVKGHHPFDPTSDADDEEISENILYSDPDWDGVEPKAATLIRQMLSRNPEDRPSIREVLQHSWLQQLQ